MHPENFILLGHVLMEGDRQYVKFCYVLSKNKIDENAVLNWIRIARKYSIRRKII